jgi:hypothetical protein
MEKENTEEKLTKAKGRRRWSEVLFCTFVVGVVVTDILVESNHLGIGTGLAVVVPFWALVVTGGIAIPHYDNLVKKYNKQTVLRRISREKNVDF